MWPRRHRLMFSLALFAFEAFEQGSEFIDFPAQGQDSRLFVTQATLKIIELAKHVAQLPLHRERSFGALFAAGDGDVMEAFAGLREEEGVGIFERKPARDPRLGNNVAVAKLGKNHFQRTCQSR